MTGSRSGAAAGGSASTHTHTHTHTHTNTHAHTHGTPNKAPHRRERAVCRCDGGKALCRAPRLRTAVTARCLRERRRATAIVGATAAVAGRARRGRKRRASERGIAQRAPPLSSADAGRKATGTAVRQTKKWEELVGVVWCGDQSIRRGLVGEAL